MAFQGLHAGAGKMNLELRTVEWRGSPAWAKKSPARLRGPGELQRGDQGVTTSRTKNGAVPVGV